jgi:hypothetical protein
MLVRDQDGGKRMRIVADNFHAAESLAAGDTGIDQNAGRCAGHNGAIATAARRQH